jgi:16S rRNA (cytosine967-C5)-methyltransferase
MQVLSPEKFGISPARTSAFDILMRVETEQAYAAELLHSGRLDALSGADHGLAMEIVMGVLRWRSWLDSQIHDEISRPLHKLDLEVLVSMRMAVYQMGWLERVPARAAINESVELVKRAHKRSAAPFVNAVLRKLAQPAALKPEPFTPSDCPGGEDALVDTLCERLAHPEWLVQRWLHAYGPEPACAVSSFDQRVPQASLRLVHASAELELESAGVKLAPGALMRSARRVVSGDASHTQACAEGRVFVQDEASQLVAALVGRAQRILDCCAAPGGKTAAMADRNPQSEIIAVELHEHRARLMQKLVRHENVRIVTGDATALSVDGQFDCVLADVPCSGTGTLARNPEIKWRLKPDDLDDLHARQVAILRAAIDRLAPGGRAVYSTCSLEPEENETVVDDVLSGREDVRVVPCSEVLQRLREEDELVWPQAARPLTRGSYLRTLPGVHPCDGFFAAVLQRT